MEAGRRREQITVGGRGRDLGESGHRPAVQHATAALARGRTDVDDPVRVADDIHVVLDDEQRVACGLQFVEDHEQWFGIGRVQPG